MSNIENLESALGRLKTNDSVVYFLTYDTKTTPRAAIKHIYDIALTLKQSGVDAKILAEDSNYSGVSTWLSDKYKDAFSDGKAAQTNQVYVGGSYKATDVDTIGLKAYQKFEDTHSTGIELGYTRSF